MLPTNHESTEELNRERILSWWGLMGEEPSYPASTATAAKLLLAVDYVADPDRLLAAMTDGWFPSPEKDGTRLQWAATDIVAAAVAFEHRRLWKPFSMVHGHKLTLPERIVQACEVKGEEVFDDLSQFDVPALLGMLHSVSHRHDLVCIVTEALRIKLRRTGVIA
jgi:hypothetical protein